MYCSTNPAAVNPTLTLADLVHSTRVTGWGEGKGWGGGRGDKIILCIKKL